MSFNPIGDIAQSLMMRRRGNSLRQELTSLTQELASGKSRDLAANLRGNFSTISAVEHSIKIHDGFSSARRIAEQVLDFSQQALGAMQTLVDDIGPQLLAASTSTTGVQTNPYVAKGPDLFRDLVSYANTQNAGRFIFAGSEYNTKPFPDADAMLNDISTATAGSATAADFHSCN